MIWRDVWACDVSGMTFWVNGFDMIVSVSK